jgi:regulator of sigma E protease
MSIPSPIITLLAFAVALGVLVFVHELGHFLVAKRLGVKVLRFSIGFGPLVFARTYGETEYALSAIPLDEEEARVDPARAFSTQPTLRRSAIVFAGPAMNFLFAFLAYLVLFGTVGAEVPSNLPRVGGIAVGSAAEKAGLQPGDRIVEISGAPIDTWEQLSQAVLGSKGAPLTFTVDRGGARFPLEIAPERKVDKNIFGEEQGYSYRIGIEASRDWIQVGPFQAVGMAATQTWTASAVVAKGLLLMVQGRVPLRELGGPIAIAKAAGQQARAGLKYFLSMLAFLSINLGVLNLLPIPALDGGHLALFAIERIAGPLRPRHREIAQQVGLLLLISLMVFVFYNDIHRLVQG